MRATFFALLVWTCLTGRASAQLLDDILLNPKPDGTVEAVIKMDATVELLQYYPEHKSQHLEILFRVLVDSSSVTNVWQGYEARTSPPSDLIPGFTVAARDMLTQPKLVIDFVRPAEYSVRIGKNRRSLVITIKSDKPLPASQKAEPATKNETPSTPSEVKAPVAAVAVAAPTPVTPATPVITTSAPATPATPVVPSATVAPEASSSDQIREMDSQSEALMTQGREALKTSQYGVAIESFNKVLQLPPNKNSQEAQELVGFAREMAGQKFKAQREYETYLSLYTSGDGVARVKERLAKLAAEKPAQAAQAVQDLSQPTAPADKNVFQTISNGGISMNYYHGVNQTVVSGTTVQSGPVTDQSMLITNINASLRSRNDRYDNRLVFQDTYNKNFLTTLGSQTNPNRLGAAYYDFKDRLIDLFGRIGRQSPIGGGVMGRFDGVWAGYGILSNLLVTSALGQLSDYPSGSKPTFYSIGAGLRNSRNWGGSMYYVSQQTNGLTDRKSVGGDMRYFDERKNAYALLDYDVFFHALNMAMLQGTINGAQGTTYNFNLDHRRSPSLSLSNALIGSQSTMSQMLQNGFTIDDLKALALLRTGTVNSASLGVNTQFKEKWQAGADINVSKSADLPQSGTNVPGSLDGYVPPTPSTGANYGINGRLIGAGVFAAHDISVFSLGYTSSALSKGENFTFSNHLNMAEKWMLDSSLRLNWQSSYDLTSGSLTGKVMTVSPAFRLGYQVKNNVNLECDYGLDITENIPTNGQSSKTTRNYFSLGGRWDL